MPDSVSLASFLDHTQLKPTATREVIERTCDEALEHGFAGVCVNTVWLPLVAARLDGSVVMPVVVVGFPLGAMASEAKAAETRYAVENGAREIDMVLQVGLLKAGEDARVQQDIAAVVHAAGGLPVKVILETAMLTDEEKVRGCLLAKAAGAAFVKTSTGFGGGGATVEDVRLMRETVGPDMGVKASGGVRTAAVAQQMIAAGATRIGASSSVAIVTGGAGTGGY
ncbi:MAG: deoxyribose-phosphate aldolase [Myxococcota bacterium]